MIAGRELMGWPLGLRLRVAAELLTGRLRHPRDGTLDGICRARLGPTLYARSGLRAYVERFHHVPATQIDEAFFQRRMGLVERATRPAALLRRAIGALSRGDPAPVAPPLRVRPRAGMDALFAPIRVALEASGVEVALNEPVTRIAADGEGFSVGTAAGTRRVGAVAATIPLDTTHRAVFGTPSGLASIDLMTLFVSARWLSPDIGNVLFNFHEDGRWKRATIHSRLYPDTGAPRAHFSVEVTLPPGARADPEDAFADLATHLGTLALADGLRLEGHALTPSAYPLYAPGHAARVAEVLDRLQAAGIVTAGRQGRFEYLPTASGVIARVGEELAAAGLPGAEGAPPAPPSARPLAAGAVRPRPVEG